MINLIPSMLLTMSMFTMTVSMLLILTMQSYIIEWEVCATMSYAMKLDLMLEWSSMMFSSAVMFISSMTLKFSKEYMKHDQNKLRFLYIVLLFIASMNLLIFIPNLICLLIGWDGLGVTSFILVIYYNNSRSLSGGMITMLTNRAGDMFLLMAIVVTLNNGDWLSMYTLNNNFHLLQWTGILTASMTKSAQIPFSSWLPAAMAAPTPVSALVHSSTLVTAGVFMLYRFNNLITSSTTMQKLLMLTGVTTMLIASMSAIYENDIKKVIALSTLSQLGLMMVSLSMNMPKLMFFHMLMHALFKALLFISAGCMISMNNHIQDLRLYGQFNTMSPIASASMMIATTALMGISFMTGYYSKHVIMDWSQSSLIPMIKYLLLMLAILLTAIYSLRLVLLTMVLPLKQTAHMNNAPKDYNLTLFTMSMASICMGTIIQWTMPLSPPHLSINENSMYHYMDLAISLLLLSLSLMTMCSPMKNSQPMSKMFMSMMFLTPISTQFIMKPYMLMSLQLHKNLDQTWLEMVGPNISPHLNSISMKLNSLLPVNPQSMLLMSCMMLPATITLLSIL